MNGSTADVEKILKGLKEASLDPNTGELFSDFTL